MVDVSVHLSALVSIVKDAIFFDNTNPIESLLY